MFHCQLLNLALLSENLFFNRYCPDMYIIDLRHRFEQTSTVYEASVFPRQIISTYTYIVALKLSIEWIKKFVGKITDI